MTGPLPSPPILGAHGRVIRQARQLRRTMSKPEVLLWQRLRGHLGGERWRKRHPFGAYVLDFLNSASRAAERRPTLR